MKRRRDLARRLSELKPLLGTATGEPPPGIFPCLVNRLERGASPAGLPSKILFEPRLTGCSGGIPEYTNLFDPIVFLRNLDLYVKRRGDLERRLSELKPLLGRRLPEESRALCREGPQKAGSAHWPTRDYLVGLESQRGTISGGRGFGGAAPLPTSSKTPI